jgi:Protein of unknown function (DUF2384)
MSIPVAELTVRPDSGVVLAMAVLKAADKLGVKGSAPAPILGVSEATVSRIRSGDYRVDAEKKAVARVWLTNKNSALGGTSAEQIRTVTRLVDVITYLDRAYYLRMSAPRRTRLTRAA